MFAEPKAASCLDVWRYGSQVVPFESEAERRETDPSTPHPTKNANEQLPLPYCEMINIPRADQSSFPGRNANGASEPV